MQGSLGAAMEKVVTWIGAAAPRAMRRAGASWVPGSRGWQVVQA